MTLSYAISLLANLNARSHQSGTIRHSSVEFGTTPLGTIVFSPPQGGGSQVRSSTSKDYGRSGYLRSFGLPRHDAVSPIIESDLEASVTKLTQSSGSEVQKLPSSTDSQGGLKFEISPE